MERRFVTTDNDCGCVNDDTPFVGHRNDGQRPLPTGAVPPLHHQSETMRIVNARPTIGDPADFRERDARGRIQRRQSRCCTGRCCDELAHRSQAQACVPALAAFGDSLGCIFPMDGRICYESALTVAHGRTGPARP